MRYFHLTSQGEDLGMLSSREEKIYAAGEIGAQAELRAKIEALPPANDTGQSYILRDDVLALFNRGSE